MDLQAHMVSHTVLGSQGLPRVASGPSAPDPHSSPERPPTHRTQGTPILVLPNELLGLIVQWLEPRQIAHLSATCRHIRQYAASDFLWQRLVQENVPGVRVHTPGPFQSFRELYATHNRLWFLTRHRLWFSDTRATGKLIIVRYDPRRAVIEGYQLVTDKAEPRYERWNVDSDVEISFFTPYTSLHKDRPILQFRPGEGGARRFGATTYTDETPILLDERDAGICSNFVHARALDPAHKPDPFYPYDNIWPPPAIPATHRISGLPVECGLRHLKAADRPACQAEESQYAFRIKRWMEMRGALNAPVAGGEDGTLSSRLNFISRMHAMSHGIPLHTMNMRSSVNVDLGEDVSAWATLPDYVLTPTEAFPYRGIWVGDYSGHGPEFVLIDQDDSPGTGSEAELENRDEETPADDAQRTASSSLRAIKLTGDPNVPRGECTFYADDLGPAGCVGTVDGSQLGGDGREPVPVVRSKGHIARTGFFGDAYIDCRLILVSRDRLAVHWLSFGHISFFERVEIEKFLAP